MAIRRKYYYAMYEWNVWGRCSCFGHATRCKPRSQNEILNKEKVVYWLGSDRCTMLRCLFVFSEICIVQPIPNLGAQICRDTRGLHFHLFPVDNERIDVKGFSIYIITFAINKATFAINMVILLKLSSNGLICFFQKFQVMHILLIYVSNMRLPYVIVIVMRIIQPGSIYVMTYSECLGNSTF